MDPYILIPKNKAYKEVKDGRFFGFWNEFWKDFSKKELYEKRITIVSKLVDNILSSTTDDDLIYAKVTLDKRAKSKSNKPWLIWEDSGLDIVTSKNDLTYTVSGKKREFERIKNAYSRSNFNTAKKGTGVTVKEKNIQRELYSVSSIENISSVWNERVDNKIKILVENKSFDQILDCVIEINPNIKNINDYEVIKKKLINRFNKEKIEQIPYELFTYNMIYRANISVKEIVSLLSDKNFSEVKLIKTLNIYGAQRCIPNFALSDIKVDKPETDIVVGIIDSGVQLNTIFDSLKFNYEKYIPSHKQPNKSHGTFVASRVLFGENIFNSVRAGKLSPCAKFLDVHVLYDDPQREAYADEIILSEAISKVTQQYPNVEIYNLSVNSDEGVESDDFPVSQLTILLDKIAQEKDILFVVSSGNNLLFPSEPYETLFSNPSINTNIAPPGDALNVISVGSISKEANSNCFCCVPNYPAPFTRKGGIRGGWKKPELVIDGGNILKPSKNQTITDASHLIASENKMGVEGITVNGLSKKTGTSFSAPLISRMCVYLLDYLKKSNIDQLVVLDRNKLNLIKALLIHSASKNRKQIEDPNIQLAYGFGVPNIEDITHDDPNEATILYSDIIHHTQKKHKIHIELPESLLGKQLEFHLTLTYNPPVNNNYKSEYSMNSIRAGIRFLVPVLDEETKEYKTKYLSANPVWDWSNYYKKSFNSIDFKKTRNKIPSRLFEILIQLESSPFYEKDMAGSVDQINQPYSFILTIKDLSSQNILRKELVLSNKFNRLQISQETQIQVK